MAGSQLLREQLATRLGASTEEPLATTSEGNAPVVSGLAALLGSQGMGHAVYAGTPLLPAQQLAGAPLGAWNPFTVLQALSSAGLGQAALAQGPGTYLPGLVPRSLAAAFPPIGPPPALGSPQLFPSIPQPPQASYQPAEAPPLPATPTALQGPPGFEPQPRRKNKKRARILKDGQLTVIVYGANEALLWSRRIATFQQAMRGVLGERRRTFTWSGSVVDSVVGVFLTQNVADTLSSRAYMEVASRWPVRRHRKPGSSAPGPAHDLEDSVDWEAVRVAELAELSDAIKCRGMQISLAVRIKAFLNHTRETNLRRRREAREVARVVDGMVAAVAAAEEGGPELGRRTRSRAPITLEYEAAEGAGSESSAPPAEKEEGEEEVSPQELLSLEWLRDEPDEDAREYLLKIDGLGRKSVACIMLLCLGKKEFPVDTNVGRISARLGWIPLDAEQAVEDMDDYAPEPEVHSYLRSRLMGFPLTTLYEAHYQMITLGKVFCSKASPNCRACPMQGECEYALNNGPSLHGRKKQRASAEAKAHDPPPIILTQPVPAAAAAPAGFPQRPPGGAMALGGGAGAPKVHWKTLAKLQRLEAERAAFAARFSILELEPLILATPRKPRSPLLRRPLPAVEVRRLLFTAEAAELEFPDANERPAAEDGGSFWEQVAEATPAAWPELSDSEPERKTAGATAPSEAGPLSAWDRLVDAKVAAESKPAAAETAEPAPGLEAAALAADAGPGPSEAAEACPPPETPVAGAGGPMELVHDASAEDSDSSGADRPRQQQQQQQQQEAEPVEEESGLAVELLQEEAQPAAELLLAEPLLEESLPVEEALLEGLSVVVDLLGGEDEAAMALPQPMLLQSVPVPDPLPSWAPGSPEGECERLVGLGLEMARIQEAILVAEGKSSTSSLKDRMVELGLQALGVDSAVTPESAQTVLAEARRHYRQLSMVVHPDRCHQPDAKRAFAALGQGMQAILQHSQPEPGAAPAAAPRPPPPGAASGSGAAGDGTKEVGPLLGGEEMLQQLVWTHNRMVLQAYLIPSELHPQLDLRHSPAPSRSTAQEPLLFLPLSAIPGYLEHGGRGGAAGSRASDSVYAAAADVMEGLLGAVEAAFQQPSAPEPADPAADAAGVGAVLRELSSSVDIVLTPPAVDAQPRALLERDDDGSQAQPEAEQEQAASAGGEAEAGLPAAAAAAASSEQEVVEGVLFVSCRAALRGRFPLNGTYFQVNECFADSVTVDRPLTVPKPLLEQCRVSPIHFGLGMHYMAKGMGQAEVAHMFAEGFVCFRAYDPATGAPAALPRWLMPSAPNTKPTVWKNKDERAAARAAKLAARGLAQPPAPAPLPPQALVPRYVRAPMPGELVPPLPPVLLHGHPLPQSSLERPWLPPPPPTPVKRKPGRPPGPSTPQGVAKKQRMQAEQRVQAEGGPAGQGQAPVAPPHSADLSPADRRSGKGRTRVQVVPKQRSSARCGTCPECLNKHWKKACSTRRGEILAGAPSPT